MKKNIFITTIKKYFYKNITCTGRWEISHLKYKNQSISNQITERKIDLANHDSCYCNKINNCIKKN